MDSNIIQVPSTEEFKDLREIVQKKYDAALRNLVTGSTPKEVKLERKARGSKDVTYVPGWWFIEQANALFLHLWNHEVVDQFVGEGQVWVKCKVSVVVPGRTITEKLPGGGEVVTRIETVTVSKTQFGGSEVKKYSQGEKTGQIIDVADDLKSAATDGMKKCLSEFGFASDVYRRHDKEEETGPQKSQLDALYKIGTTKGMSKEEVDAFCVKESGGKELKKLETVEVLGLISKLRSK